MTSDKLQVRCPSCGKQFGWDETLPSRPFCSDRCRLIDLGEWLEEGHKIPDTGESKPFMIADEEP